ncbi:MAG: bifunctional 3-deoxy-7-phosphoheptulonate synthase/chorismate mutase type II [Bacteroidetes bacterium]|nr:bifunctional 3-deoxy-7-phosphoheptulonate synthase/chorismate mutase type II [Bacteroidota bacterium]
MEPVALELKHISNIVRKRPLIIAGPCSAETETQVIETAQLLAQTGQVDLLRAGIWKPRTRPGSFEGIGAEGLAWLQQAKAATGLPTCIEIANSAQVDQALKANIDVLWIGARSTVNPFSVQDIADALRGVDIPVFIKNPIHPDIELWTGAVERVAQAGIGTIGLIHRGFAAYGNTAFRNAPMWHLAIEMKRRHEGLPFINDPSHICGRRDTLQTIAQKAIDLDYDGLMIEVHPRPDEAWSDAAQQLTPDALSTLLSQIVWRKEGCNNTAFHEALEKLRHSIDGLDDEIIQLLGQRMKLAEEIAAYKKIHGITILQTARWNSILARMKQEGIKLGLNDSFIQHFLDAVHMESITHQTEVFNRK